MIPRVSELVMLEFVKTVIQKTSLKTEKELDW